MLVAEEERSIGLLLALTTSLILLKGYGGYSGVLEALWSESSSPDTTGVWKPRTVITAGSAGEFFMAHHVDALRQLEFAIGSFGTVLVGSVRASGSGTGRESRLFDWFLVAFAIVFLVDSFVSPVV